MSFEVKTTHHIGWYTGSLFIVLLATGPALRGQAPLDSIDRKANRLRNRSTEVVDSLKTLANANRWRDSLSINAWSEDLQKKINSRFSDAKLASFADSLRSVGVSKRRIRLKSDSLLRRKEGLLKEAQEKHKALQGKVSSRYQKWSEAVRRKFNLDSAGLQLPGHSSPDSPVSVPGASAPIPGLNAGSIPALPTLELTDFGSLNFSPELSSLGAVPTLPELGDLQKNIPHMPDPGGEISKQIGSVKGLAANPDKALEQGVGQVGEMNDASKALKEAEQLKTSNELVKASDQLKDPNAAISAGKQEAVDHFAGQEAALQGAMNQMAKYKKKYSSLGSLSEIKKNDWLPRNGLKGKPFKERFRPGLNLAYRGGKDTLLFDIFPNAAYRISGRIEAGLGASYRLRVMQSPFGFDQHEPVWGMNTFVVVKTFKSVYVRVEMDGNSHPVAASSDRAAYRDWRWTFYSGIQTTFKISARWQGNAQMLYGFDKSLKDGFPERLNARVGVQYKLVK